ncbi:MAG: RNA-binding protein [Gammaproteobacteria bacterium]|nr:RNA-binding protein [Gammaproteobacteria bacterium]
MDQRKLFVGNLPFKISSNDLQDIFEEYGEVEDLVIISDRETGRSKGFGFVTFTSQENAKKALALDGKEIQGRQIRVNIAKEKEEGSRSGGRGDSRGRG